MDSYGKPEIFNSDQGSQFTSSEFVTELRAHFCSSDSGLNFFMEREPVIMPFFQNAA